jgi:hypothetical protein
VRYVAGVSTTWIDLVGYVRVRYEIFQQTDRTLRFHLPTEHDRTQRVALHHVPPGAVDGADWVVIESAIARMADVDLGRLLERAGESVIGGIIAADGVVLLRHTISLADLALGAFDKPFRLVVAAADALESEFTGTDKF